MTDEIDDDYVAPKTPFDYISNDQLQDLWGAGFTVIRRNTFGNDLYAIADRLCKAGLAQQWSDGPKEGWTSAPAERHPGLYAPYSYAGDVKIGGLTLLECPKHKVDAAKEAQVAAANKLVTDWQDKYGGEFSGTVTVGTQTELGKLDKAETLTVGETKSIEYATKIPPELIPYISQVFADRDALYDDLVTKWNSGQELDKWQDAIRKAYEVQLSLTPEAPSGPTLNRLILPTAIENVRKRLKEATSGQAS
jgi:hypothetical protein